MSTLEVNNIKDTGSNSLISSDGSGTFTINNNIIKNAPAFFARMSANQTISANTVTKVDFDTEVLDTDSAYSTADQRFTVPTGMGGYYFLFAAVGVDDGNSTSQQTLTMYVNGNRQNTSGFGTRTFATSGSFGIQTTGLLNLSASDYVDVRVKLETATDVFDELLGDNMRSHFFGYRLIGV